METMEGYRWLDALASNRRLGDLATNPWRRTVVPAVSTTPVTEAVSGLELGPVIGEGGMAVVREAIQPQLGRGVAVKALRPEAATTSDARRLLQEAWTTGALEHPNIIPVHDIAWAADGSPRVLLKRVRGRAWSELLDDSGSPDLERDLRILLDVARALDFAHQAGFVHRDVKPSNVLIGEHGDVYLADWGIAVALHDDGTGRFPLAAEVDAMAGTPAYMAPEMVDPRVAPIGPWTDVYLLGAVLLELMSGEPPHDVTSAATLVTSVFAHPNIPGVDHELRAICARALAPQPADRYVGAGAFREAVADYLRYSGARAVAVRADASAAKWRACADKTSGEAEAALAEARFGYAAAMGAWPDYDHAATRSRALECSVVAAEIEAGDLAVARRTFNQLDDPPPSLARRLETVEAARQQSQRRWQALETMSNTATGQRARTWVVGLLCTLWVVAPLFRGSLARVTPMGIVAPYLASVLIVGALVFMGRASLF
ncbi:MAG: serine/threonine-protein kinase, partial [Myxococcota bacterium]